MKTLRVGAAIAAAIALTLSACATNQNGSTSGSSNSSASPDTLSGTLQGTGASSAKAAQDVWRAAFQEAHPKVTVNYSPDGSGAGRTAFSNGAAAFAGSDAALADSAMSGTFANCATGTKPLNLPIYISPIAIIYNVQGVSNLQLDAPTVAKIFRGQITKWDDPAIAALNPSAKLPSQAITPVHRSDNSGTTDNFSNALHGIAPSIWTDASSGDWPAALGGEGAQGTTGVVAAVKGGAGTIGYADESGVPSGMTTATYSKDGKGTFVGPTAADANQIVEASQKVAGRDTNDWALNLDRTAAGYPFVLVSYAIVCQQYKDAAMGSLVQAYISYVASDAAQTAAQSQAGNAPLSGTLAAGVQKAASSIK